MRWTKERTTGLGTYYEKRTSWHGVPVVVRAHGPKGMSRTGWVVSAVLVLLLVAVALLEELVV